MKLRKIIKLHIGLLGMMTAGVMATSADATAGFQLETVAEGLVAPHALVSPPGDARRFVVDQIGLVYILDADGRLRETPFLDIRDRVVDLRGGYDERGLLGLAFHPKFAANGRFFVYYSAPLRDEAPDNWNHTSRLSEFRVVDDGQRADGSSERIVLRIDQPQMNHNGGNLAFGPDGYLYVALGDGGAAGDVGLGHPPLGNGQDVTTLLGSILRIDIEQIPYGIPPTNPLVNVKLPDGGNFEGEEPRPEIWAWGIRNAWGMSFDRETGRLYAADVGQLLWEEVNWIEAGNYGWPIKEGTHWFDAENMTTIISEGRSEGPLGKPLVDPVVETPNTSGQEDGVGNAMVGGYVYRGSKVPDLRGKYIFANWSRGGAANGGVLLVAEPTQGASSPQGAVQWEHQIAKNLKDYILGFGEDADGELYVLVSDKVGPSGKTGRVLAIRPD